MYKTLDFVIHFQSIYVQYLAPVAADINTLF